MLAKVTSGSGLRGGLTYDLSAAKNGEPRGQWVAGSLIGTAREMARQAGAFRALRPDCKKAVMRVSLSADPADGFLSEKKWAQIAEDFLREMAIDPKNHAWVAIRHQDLNKFGQPHDHIHLSVVRVSGSGQLWNQEFSAKRAIKASEFLEQKHDLETHAREPPDRCRPQKNEQEMKNRKGNTEMPREKITNAIDAVLAKHPGGIDYEDFKRELEQRGVNVRAALTKSDQLQGFSFESGGIAFSGSKLGADFGLSKLKERGVRPPMAAQSEQAPKPAADEFLRAEPSRPADTARPQPQQQHLPAKPKRRTAEEDDEAQEGTSLLGPAPMSLAARQQRAEHYKQRQQAIQNRVDSSNFAKAFGLLGLAISHFAIELIARFIEWLKHFLGSKLGVGVRENITKAPNGQHKVNLQPTVIDVEAKFIESTTDPLLLEHKLEEQLDQAGQAADQIVKAVTEKDFDGLPGVGSTGRAQLVNDLKKAAELDAAAGFAAAAAEQLSELETCFVAHKDLAVETWAANVAPIENPFINKIESAEKTISRLQNEDEIWLKEHPWQAKLAWAEAPNIAKIAAEKAEKNRLQKQLEAQIAAAEAAAAPAIEALQVRQQQAFGALQGSYNTFNDKAAKAQDFAKDPRFSVESAQFEDRAKKLKLSVQTYLSNFQCQIDPSYRRLILSEIKAAREALNKWAEVAKPQTPEGPKPLSNEERRERPDDDQHQAPR